MNLVHHVEETASTNDDARALAAGGAPDGTVVVARRQTAGRGRRGHSWQTLPDRSVALSYVHRTHMEPSRLLGLTLDCAVAAATALEDLAGLEVSLKWPNDLLVDGRKVGGILTELHTDLGPKGSSVVVVGVGINLLGRIEELPPEIRDLATTVEAASRLALDPGHTALLVARRLREKLAGFEAAGAPDLVAFGVRFPFRGAEVEVDPGTGKVERGRIDGLLEDGSLQVFLPGGCMSTPITSGEVRLVHG